MPNYNVAYVFEAVDNMSRNIKTIRENLKGMEKDFDNTSKKLPNFNQRMKSAGEVLEKVGQKARWFSITASAAIVGSVVAFAKFDEQVKKTQGILDTPDISKFTGQIKDVYKEAIKMGFGIEDAGKGIYDTISAVGAGAKAFDIFKVSQKLSIGANADLRTSVDGLTSVVNAYGREQTNVNEVASAFFTASKVGKVEVVELAQNFGKVGSIAANAGVSFKEVLSMMSELTNAGLGAEEATTGLRSALSNLIKPSDDAKKVMAHFGIATDISKLKNDGIIKTLQKLQDVQRKYPQLIARIIPDIQGMNAVMSLLNKESLTRVVDNIEQMNKDIANGTGLNDAYATNMKSLVQQFKMLKGELLASGIVLGNTWSPSISKAIGYTSELLKNFQALAPRNQMIIEGFVGMTAILAPMATAFGILLKVVGSTALVASAQVITVLASSVLYLVYALERLSLYSKDFGLAFFKSVKDAGTVLQHLPLGLGIIGNAVQSIGQNAVNWKEERNDINERLVPMSMDSMKPNNMSFADINLNINAPKGSVKNMSAVSGSGLNLGVNMSTAGSY